MIRIHRFVPLASMLLLGAAIPARPADIPWTLFEPGCADGNSTLEVACGDYGVFHFLTVVAPEGCDPVQSGLEDPPGYPPPGSFQAFPVDPTLYNGSFEPAPQSTGGSSARSLAVHGATPPPVVDIDAAAAGGSWSDQPSVPSLPAPVPLLFVIDFAGPHSASVTFAAHRAAGAESDAYLTLLDDPELAPLGPGVGDFHVLAKLCEVADGVDTGQFEAPQIVNMSFGRAVLDADVAADTDCDPARAGCQIARVIGHMRDEGTLFVAAAGNHRETLFPAWLDEVISIGMLDLDTFFEDGTVEPAWETPLEADGVLPGNSLCLRYWPAPAGASYSAALFTGWLSSVLAEKPNLDPMVLRSWAPRYHDDLGCYVLTAGDDVFPWCNGYATTIFDGLLGDNEDICWFDAETPAAETGPPTVSSQPAALPSFDEYVSMTSATPESDPCVPCVGLFGPNESFVIDFSQTPPYPEEIHLDEVVLRVGSSFYTMLLSPSQLQDIEDGNLAQLVLNGWAPLASSGEPMSARFHMKTVQGASCSPPDPHSSCYWTSVPVLTKP